MLDYWWWWWWWWLTTSSLLDSAFSINNATGQILTTRPLDRENISQYLLIVKVCSRDFHHIILDSSFLFFYRLTIVSPSGHGPWQSVTRRNNQRHHHSLRCKWSSSTVSPIFLQRLRCWKYCKRNLGRRHRNNSLDLSCLLCAVCKSVFTDCRDISTLYYINHLDMVTTTTTKSWSPMWNSLDLSCLLCAVCKSVFTDCRDISTLYYINHLDMVTVTTTKSWSPMWNSLDLSCLLCAVRKSVLTDCRDISTLYYINTLLYQPPWHGYDEIFPIRQTFQNFQVFTVEASDGDDGPAGQVRFEMQEGGNLENGNAVFSVGCKFGRISYEIHFSRIKLYLTDVHLTLIL